MCVSEYAHTHSVGMWVGSLFLVQWKSHRDVLLASLAGVCLYLRLMYDLMLFWCVLPLFVHVCAALNVNLTGPWCSWLRTQGYIHSHRDKSWIILESQTSRPEAALIKPPQRPENWKEQESSSMHRKDDTTPVPPVYTSYHPRIRLLSCLSYYV